jgi:hypothetical protein
MLVRLTTDIGSWMAGSEWDLGDAFAKGLVADGRAIRIENKRVKTLSEVMEEAASLRSRLDAEKFAGKEERATVSRNKKTKAGQGSGE